MTTKIWIEKTGDTLRLRWNYEGRKQSLSLGVSDNNVGRAIAKQRAAEIEMDLASGYYDKTLLKYKPRKTGKNPTEIPAVELFEKYISHYKKERELTHGSSLKLDAIASKIGQLLGDTTAPKITESVVREAIARWLESASSQTIKAYLYHIKNCWEWAKGKYHIADPNPWAAVLSRMPRANNSRSSQRVKPFTLAEMEAIIAAFANSPHYAHYTDFVTFLINTGCRFGEVVGLRWKHIGADFSTAWICESISRGHRNAKGTKTGKDRTISLSPTVLLLLKSRFERLEHQPEDLVFPSPKGLPIDDHNFNRRAWKTILASCKIEYRSPYKLRHTAISHAIDNGASPIALAEQTGHDKRVLLKTYAHAVNQKCLFVEVGGTHQKLK